MSKKISLGVALILIVLSVIITFQVTYLAVYNKYREKEAELISDGSPYASKLEELDEAYRSYYIGEIDDKTLADIIMKGYVAGTGDKYATYFSADEYLEMIRDYNGEIEGIGINIVYDSVLGALEIVSVMPESPALEAGVEAGDIIVTVGGEYVSDLGFDVAVANLKGKVGTLAEFTVVRDDEMIDFSVERAKVTQLTAVSRIYEVSDGDDIGIVEISEFDLKTPEQLKTEIEKLRGEGIEKIVFDVRNNPGGELKSIIEVLDYLLPEGPIVRLVDKYGNEEVKYSGESFVNIKAAVLVDQNTASAAELFASAIQDYAKKDMYDAVIVGTVTYGKGTAQSIVPLSDGSAVTISNRLYNPPYSDNYEGVGVIPDIEIDLSEEAKQIGIYKLEDSMDDQLLRAIEELNKK